MGKFRITLKETTVRIRQVEVEAQHLFAAVQKAGTVVGNEDLYETGTPPLKKDYELISEASFEIDEDGLKKKN